MNDIRRVASGLEETLSDADLEQMLKIADLDHDGVLNKEDFVALLKRIGA